MTLQELHDILKNKEGELYAKFTLRDYDGNSIDGNSIFLLDFYAMLPWQVKSICIDDSGYAIITLNSGNFKSFHFRNVY